MSATPASTRPARARSASRYRSLLLAVAIALTAVNLRPAFTSVGPVLQDISADLGTGAGGAALLATAPVLCLGLLAPAAPRIARRAGLEGALALVLLLLLVGLLVRVVDGPAVLFAGTVLAAGSIAVANVLVPALVKRDFAGRTGTMMGLYTTCLTGAAAVAAATTVPVAQASGAGWRAGLAVWALLTVPALVAWAPLLRGRRAERTAPGTSSVSLLRDPLAWQVTSFFGLQSLFFYTVVAWLPSIYRDAGLPAGEAGLLLSLCTAVQVPVGLLVPRLAARRQDQRQLVVVAVLLLGAGLLGVLLAPLAAPHLWVALVGVGLAACFALALLFTVLRARTSAGTAALSAMAQSIGYTASAAGPLSVGVLREVTGSWTPALVVLLLLVLLLLATGLRAGRALHVGAPTAPEPTGGPGRGSEDGPR